jgi:hypothetical protein
MSLANWIPTMYSEPDGYCKPNPPNTSITAVLVIMKETLPEAEADQTMLIE